MNKIISFVPYQRCPICDGKGVININTPTSLSTMICTVCKGKQIIPMCSIDSLNMMLDSEGTKYKGDVYCLGNKGEFEIR